MRRNAILPRFIAEPILREPMARSPANATSYKSDHETARGGRLDFDEKRNQANHGDAALHSHGVLICFQRYVHDSMLIIIAAGEAYDGLRAGPSGQACGCCLGAECTKSQSRIGGIAEQMRASG